MAFSWKNIVFVLSTSLQHEEEELPFTVLRKEIALRVKVGPLFTPVPKISWLVYFVD